MRPRSILSGLVLFVALLGSASPMARAVQEAREAEILGLHQLCDKGDRRACVHFGILLDENARAS